MGPGNVIVTVPVPSVGLNESDTLLDQSTGQETFPTERICLTVSDAIGLTGLFRLSINIKNPRDFHLHTVSQFIGRHTSIQFILLRTLLEMFFIELSK